MGKGIKAIAAIRATNPTSPEGIPLSVCTKCFNNGRPYLKLPWEMAKARAFSWCKKCHAIGLRGPIREYERRSRRNKIDPARKAFNKSCLERYAARKKEAKNIFLIRWAYGLETHPFKEKVDRSTPEGIKRHMKLMAVRQKLKYRILSELKRGKRKMPPLWQLELDIDRTKWKRPIFKKHIDQK